jgi:hypothetical protein
MKSICKVALVLSIFTYSISAHAQAPTPSKAGLKITKKSQLHDGCHGRFSQMLGKPCH